MGGPGFLLLTAFLILPFFMAFYLSFTDQRLISPEPAKWVGFRNYSRLLSLAVLPLEPVVDEATGEFVRDDDGAIKYPAIRDFTRNEENYPQYAGLREWFTIPVANSRYVILASDPIFMMGLRNNFIFTIAIIFLQGGTALGLALLVNQKLRGINIFRTIYFIPVVTSMVVISILWSFMYDKQVGLINQLLGALSFGLIPPIDWLGNPNVALWAIIIMSAWQAMGFHMVIWLAGLQNIPGYLYEASEIDGANSFQQFLYITWPSLRFTAIFIFITITIEAFKLFTQIDVMTQGGPQDATQTVVFHAVRKGFREQDIAYAATISVVFFCIVLVISLVQYFLTRDKE
ncbi:MAG: sugar ABC transporter permease [Anaerolineaceae bacterium]|nr:sugar ABC transporter permease [Anaerolineaceae bacterium]